MKAQRSQGRKAMVEECRLCGVQAQLRHSHVVPKLMFRSMQRFGPEIMPHQTGPERTRPRPGHAKEYMLCAGCENQFSTYEQVAGRFLADLNRYQPRPGERIIQWSSLDYAHLKLFFLSILWRCAVAEHPLSRQIDLGPPTHQTDGASTNRGPGRPGGIPGSPSPCRSAGHRQVRRGDRRPFRCARVGDAYSSWWDTESRSPGSRTHAVRASRTRRGYSERTVPGTSK